MANEPRHQFVSIDGLRLHFLDYGGSGPPILLLHGVLGQAWMWRGVAPALTPFGRVVAPDFRGYGDSQWSARQAYRTVDHAEDIRAICRELGWTTARVVGFSWGALVGLALSQLAPGLIDRLVMIDIGPSSTRTHADIPPVRMDVAEHEQAVAAEHMGAPGATEDMAETMAKFGWRPGPEGRLERKHDPFFTVQWPFLTEDWWPALEQFEAPLLIVRAADSVVCSAQIADEMRRRAQHAQLVEVAETGHLIPLVQPERLADELRDFLR